jgi:hypothetical protein
MTRLIATSLLALLALGPMGLPLSAQGTRSRDEHVKTCSAISLSRPGFGVAYRGQVKNDDYGLIAAIPPGMTGWGADPVASFHGFTIFLPGDNNSSGCILFEIHERVDLGDRGQPSIKPIPARAVRFGNIRGWQEERTGEAGGIALENILIEFSIPRDWGVADGSAWLISPVTDLRKNQALFRDFVSGIGFERAVHR